MKCKNCMGRGCESCGKGGPSGGVVPEGGKGEGFAFRPQEPGETREQYEALKAKARTRWSRKPGKARAMARVAAKCGAKPCA